MKVGGTVLITKRVLSTASILEAHPAGRAWHSGTLKIKLESVTLLDGQKVALQLQSSAKGAPTNVAVLWPGLIVTTLGLGAFALPLAPLQHGNQAEFHKGTVFEAVTGNEVLLDRAAVLANQPVPREGTQQPGDWVTLYYPIEPRQPWDVQVACGSWFFGRLERGHNVSFVLPPGKCAFYPLGDKSSPLVLQAQDNADHYIRFAYREVSPHVSKMTLSLVEQDVAEVQLPDTKPAKDKDFPDRARPPWLLMQADPPAKWHNLTIE